MVPKTCECNCELEETCFCKNKIMKYLENHILIPINKDFVFGQNLFKIIKGFILKEIKENILKDRKKFEEKTQTCIMKNIKNLFTGNGNNYTYPDDKIFRDDK